MARAASRVTRKDIRKPDRFMVVTGEVLDYVGTHKTKVIAGAAALVAILLAVWGWDLYRERQDRLAEAELTSAELYYHGGQYREALEALARLRIYGRSSTARLGLLYEANTYLALNAAAKAEGALQELLRTENKDALLRQMGFMTLAYTQERAGRCKEAVQSYAGAEALVGPFKEEALMGKARCSAALQDYKGALSAYRQLAQNFPASPDATEATLLAQEMETKAGTAPTPATNSK